MKTLLIDADSLAYRIPHAHREILAISPEEIEGDFTGDAESNWATEAVKKELAYFMKLTKCDNYELHLTAGKRTTELFLAKYGREPRSCFRYKEADALSKGYKSNRKSEPIDGYYDVMKAMMEDFGAEMHDYWEADDAVVAIKANNPDKYRLCALDKDVLNQVQGEHFNYGKLEMHFTDEADAVFYKYWQCVIGDPGDGYGGVPGVGKAKAAKFMSKDMTEQELWSIVVEMYKTKGLAEVEAIATMRLASMQQLKVKARTGITKESSQIPEYELVVFNP